MNYRVRITHSFSGLREKTVLVVDEEFREKFSRYLQVLEEIPVEEAPKPRARKAKDGPSNDLQGEG